MNSRGWIEEIKSGKAVYFALAIIKEQHLLVRLLDHNATRIPTSFKRKRTTSEGPLAPFRLSFFLPVPPVSNHARDVIGFKAPDSCAVYGVPSTTGCGSCRAIRYCSPGMRALLNYSVLCVI